MQDNPTRFCRDTRLQGLPIRLDTKAILEIRGRTRAIREKVAGRSTVNITRRANTQVVVTPVMATRRSASRARTPNIKQGTILAAEGANPTSPDEVAGGLKVDAVNTFRIETRELDQTQSKEPTSLPQDMFAKRAPRVKRRGRRREQRRKPYVCPCSEGQSETMLPGEAVHTHTQCRRVGINSIGKVRGQVVNERANPRQTMNGGPVNGMQLNALGPQAPSAAPGALRSQNGSQELRGDARAAAKRSRT